MPLLGAKSAPAKFTGKYDSVKKFIRQYKQMCAVYNVPDKEKCRRIVDYCSTRVTRFIEALDSFVDEKWNQLETDILTYYDAELNESRYLVSDLDQLTDDWRKRGMNNLKRFKAYEVEFLTIANWLRHKGKITQDEQHTKFWYGLNRKLREKVEARYLAAHPGYDPRKVIPRNEISKIVYGIFTRDRFDADLTTRKSKHRKKKRKNLLKSYDSESSTTNSDSESESEVSSSSESDRESKKDHRRRRKKRKKRKKPKPESSESEE
ncbi:hypothetical protein ARMSODRAFT_1037614, partial [Armillaria solidipes]